MSAATVREEHVGDTKKDVISPKQYTDGDIVLISSDDKCFQVHGYQLQAASSVFRSMITTSSGAASQEVHLTDSYLDNAQRVQEFLDFIHEGKLPNIHALNMNEDFLAFVRLVDKYDCPVLMRLLETSLSTMLDSKKVSPMWIFAAAAQISHLDLCTRAYRSAGDWIWETQELPGRHPLECEVGGGRIFDLTAIRLSLYEKLPTEYVVALLRSSRTGVLYTGRSDDLGAAADEFHRILASRPT